MPESGQLALTLPWSRRVGVLSSEVERRIIGDNSELARSIREHFTKADSPFRTALDPTNKAGPVGRFIHEQQESQQAAHDSYAEVQAELVEKINEEFNQIKQAMDYEGIMKRKAEELDAKDKVGTAKGTDFEIEVLDFLSEKVKPNDALSATGTKSGEGTRRKVGDLGVTVNPDAVAPFDITLEVNPGSLPCEVKHPCSNNSTMPWKSATQKRASPLRTEHMPERNTPTR